MVAREYVEVLQGLWPKNKAKGLLAQSRLEEGIASRRFGRDAGEKFMPGCWLVSPKEPNFHQFRFCFFVHPTHLRPGANFAIRDLLGNKFRPFNALAEFMNNAAIKVVYAVPFCEELPLQQLAQKNYGGLEWRIFFFENGNFVETTPRELFDSWPGNRGRPGQGNPWDESTIRDFQTVPEERLESFVLSEVFFSGFLKATHRKPTSDPYDVDFFLVSLSQKHLFPI